MAMSLSSQLHIIKAIRELTDVLTEARGSEPAPMDGIWELELDIEEEIKAANKVRKKNKRG